MEVTGLAYFLHDLGELLLVAGEKVVEWSVSRHDAVFADIEAIGSARCVGFVVLDEDLSELMIDFLCFSGCHKGLVPDLWDLIVNVSQSSPLCLVESERFLVIRLAFSSELWNLSLEISRRVILIMIGSCWWGSSCYFEVPFLRAFAPLRGTVPHINDSYWFK